MDSRHYEHDDELYDNLNEVCRHPAGLAIHGGVIIDEDEDELVIVVAEGIDLDVELVSVRLA